MANAHFTGLYTLTPTHCGTGQTSGAVDLPIARESHTGLPVLPASSLKGAARHAFHGKLTEEEERILFGSEVNQGNAMESVLETKPGALVIMEGRLLVYPLRSLQRPFVYATCPLIIERLARDARALGIRLPPLDEGVNNLKDSVLVSKELAGNPLIVEDFVYAAPEVQTLPDSNQLSKVFSSLLPNSEVNTRKRISEGLVILPDTEFADLVRRVMPVQARIRLGDEKTTTGEKGNLWYEETLPPDCLFGVFITSRPGLPTNGNDPCKIFLDRVDKEQSIQIGGNETVGHGYCWWTALTA